MSLPWDQGVQWRTAVTVTDPAWLAVDQTFITQRVLRAFTNDAEAELIEFYIRAATAFVERRRGEHVAPKTLTITLDAFPAGAIEFVDGPVLDVSDVTYFDSDGIATTYDNVSPHTWVFVSGGRMGRASLQPAIGSSWPATSVQPNAAVVTFTVGYTDPADVPIEIQHEIACTVGELYKNPDLSNAEGQTANTLGLMELFPRRWSNGL